MTTSAPKPSTAPVLGDGDPRAVRAWQVYRESLRGLEGADYESAESRAWDRLQRVLSDLAGTDATPDDDLD